MNSGISHSPWKIIVSRAIFFYNNLDSPHLNVTHRREEGLSGGGKG